MAMDPKPIDPKYLVTRQIRRKIVDPDNRANETEMVTKWVHDRAGKTVSIQHKAWKFEIVPVEELIEGVEPIQTGAREGEIGPADGFEFDENNMPVLINRRAE